MLDVAHCREACLAALADAPSSATVGNISACCTAGGHLSLMCLMDELQRCQIEESLSMGKLLADFITVRSAIWCCSLAPADCALDFLCLCTHDEP